MNTKQKKLITVDDVREYDTSPFFQKKYFLEMFPDGCEINAETFQTLLYDLCDGKLHRVEKIIGMDKWIDTEQYKKLRRQFLQQLRDDKARTEEGYVLCRQAHRDKEKAKKQPIKEQKIIDDARWKAIEAIKKPLREKRDQKIAKAKAVYDAAIKKQVGDFERDNPKITVPGVDVDVFNLPYRNYRDILKGHRSRMTAYAVGFFKNVANASGATNA